MFEEGRSSAASQELTTNPPPEALTLEAMHQKVETLTAIIMQQQETIKIMQCDLAAQQEESAANIARLDPEQLLNFLNTQEPSSALFNRWLLENQRNGLPFAHSLLQSIGNREGIDVSELSCQMLLLIKKLPQTERNQFLEYTCSHNKTLEQYVLSKGWAKQFIAYVNCLAPSTTLTVKHDEEVIRRQPRLFPLMIGRLEAVYTTEQLLAFYQRQDGSLKTIGHYIEWGFNYDKNLVVEYFRVLATFSKSDQLNILSLKDKTGRCISPCEYSHGENLSTYFSAIDVFEVTEQLALLISVSSDRKVNAKIITLLNQLSDEELKDYLPKVDLANIGFMLMEYGSKASLEQKTEFLNLIKKLSKGEQYKLLQEKEGSSSLLELCLLIGFFFEMLDIIIGFYPNEQVKLLKSKYYYDYVFQRPCGRYDGMVEVMQEPLIAYLGVLSALEPAQKLSVLAFEYKEAMNLNTFIMSFFQAKSGFNVVIAYFTCLGDTKLPISLNDSTKQVVVDAIKDMPEEKKVQACVLALKEGSALNRFLSIKTTYGRMFCLPKTKRPDSYLEQLQALLPTEQLALCSANLSNPIHGEVPMERQPLMTEFRNKEEEDKANNPNLRRRAGFSSK